MSRIRSIHPSFWLDRAFLSSFARILFLGLGNFADDAGIFEWKPKHLKLKILPNDRINIDKILDELKEEGLIETYEVNGKQYGVIRNFTQWQKPKNPVYKYPSMDSQITVNCHSNDAQKHVKSCSDVSQLHALPENDNKNNELQKKLSIPTHVIGEESIGEYISTNVDTSPQTPHDEKSTVASKAEIIPINATTRLFTESVALLQGRIRQSEIACHQIVGKWLKQAEQDAELVASAIEDGLHGHSPVPYITAIIRGRMEEKKNPSAVHPKGKTVGAKAYSPQKEHNLQWMVRKYQPMKPAMSGNDVDYQETIDQWGNAVHG